MSLPIILASTSVFRQQQLRTLGVDFVAAKPMFDETPLAGESPSDTALRLAIGKAQSLAQHYPQHLIIGADQSGVVQQSSAWQTDVGRKGDGDVGGIVGAAH